MPDFKPVMKDYKQLTPFKFQILQSFPFIAEDFDSLTNYELLCKVVEYLNDVINNEKNVEDNVTALYNSFVELQDYVNNYFDNLDVQDEINNKLDEMASDGTLYNIIRRYTEPIVNEQNLRIAQVENELQSLASGSPLVASSVSGMTDTTKVYVNTTDGNWYYYNGSAWTIGGIYQSTYNSDDYEYQINLKNYGTVSEGKYINYNTGNLGSLEELNASDYIEITGLAKIIIENLQSRSGVDSRGLAYYDDNKNYISGYQYPEHITSISNISPQNARYFRFTYYANLTPTVSIINQNEKILNELFNPYYLTNFQYDITDYLMKTKNNRGYINKDTGNIAIYTSLEIFYTKYFPIKSGIKIRIKNAGSYADVRGLAFYSEDLTFISGNQYTSSNFEVTAPQNAKYVAFTINNDYLDTSKFILKGNYKDILELISNKENTPVINPTKYNGNSATTFKKLLAIGDSLTSGVFNHNEGGRTEYVVIREYSYPTQIKKATGIEVDNLGYGGLTTKEWYEQMADNITDGHDFCIINLGANDTEANHVTTNEVNTYLRNIISKVKELNPKIKIFIMSLLPNYYYRNVNWYQPFRWTVKNIAETVSDCYYVDMTQFSDCIDNSVYSQGHLTALGYKKEAEELINYISYIIDNNPTDFKYIQFIGTDYEYNE